MTKRVVPEFNLTELLSGGSAVEEIEEALDRHGNEILHMPLTGKLRDWFALHYACKKGNIHLVKLFLDRGARCDVVQAQGYTPLYAAILWGHEQIVDLILSREDSGIFTDILRLKRKFSILGGVFRSKFIHYAQKEKSFIHIIQSLMKHGANIYQLDSIPPTTPTLYPLFCACKKASLNIVKCMLENESAREIVPSPLVSASQNFDHGPDIIRYLISKGFVATVDVYKNVFQFGYPHCLASFPKPDDPLLLTFDSFKMIFTNSCDPIGMAKVAISFGYKANFLYRTSITKRVSSNCGWTMLRHVDQKDLLNEFPSAAVDVSNEHVKWWQRERATRIPNDLFHKAAKTSLEQTMKMMNLRLNPLIPDDNGYIPADVAATPEIRQQLLAYATWDTSFPQKTWWYGPFFQMRARSFLLVCKRLTPKLPLEIRHLLVAYIARAEHIWVKLK